MCRWMEEKSKIANDQTWTDAVNLQRKLQKHEAFEMELKANAERVDTLNSVNDN
jgi:hypothetical protein